MRSLGASGFHSIAKTSPRHVQPRKFEDVVKSVEQATVLVLVY